MLEPWDTVTESLDQSRDISEVNIAIPGNWYDLYYLEIYSNRSSDTLNCSSQAIEPSFAIIRYGALLVTIKDCVQNDERRQQNMVPNGLYSRQWVLTYIKLIP